DAYYGRSVADAAGADDFTVKTETMLPVFMATLVLSTGWTAVLWDDSFAAGPATVWDGLKLGLGLARQRRRRARPRLGRAQVPLRRGLHLLGPEPHPPVLPERPAAQRL